MNILSNGYKQAVMIYMWSWCVYVAYLWWIFESTCVCL